MPEEKRDKSLLGKLFKPSASMLESVAPPGTKQAEQRKEGLKEVILDATLGVGRDLARPDTTDRWAGRGTENTISVETERERTLRLQEELDRQIEQENLGITPIRKGLPPCLRVRDEGK